nr:RecName: Full=Tereporin-Ts1; AltName: Full=Actinoporin-like protein; Flags: Precursor [Terebra subulata]
VIFALVLGNASPVQSVAITATAVATAIGAASQIISAGTSLASTILSGLAASGYRVTCAIQVENWTRYPLIYATVQINRNAAVTVSPSSILPGKREGFSVRMPNGLAEGVYGTVSWELLGIKRRFVLMWSAPFNFNHFSNWMGVGLTRPGITKVPSGMTWFNKMYYDKTGRVGNLHFERGEFYYETNPVIYRDSKFEIEGTMTNIHNA